jgi:MATE family multidrug resistance protein
MTILTSTPDRLAEARALLRLAGPLIVNTLSIAGMQFADAVMAGQLGAEALAAVAVGAGVWLLGFTVCLGLMMAISPIAARFFGAGELAMIGRYTRQGLVLALILGGGYLVLAQLLVGPALALLDIDSEFRDLTVGYVKAITLGAPAICAFLALRFTSEGIGYTRPIMYTSLFALVSNVFFNYVFMYGHFGAPAMGAVGWVGIK